MNRRRRSRPTHLQIIEILEPRQLLTYTPPTVAIAPFNYYSGPLASTESPNTGDDTPQVTSQAGVAYGSGGVSPESPDLLTSDGFGSVTTGLQLGWTNLTGFGDVDAGSPFGKGMDDSALPYIVSAASGGIDAISGSGDAVFFSESGSSYSPMMFSTDSLASDGDGGYKITQSDGTVLDFYGFGSGVPTLQQGQLEGYVDANGNATTTTYNSSGQLTAVERNDGTNAEVYAYSYLTSGDNTGKVSNIALERGPVGGSMTTVRQVALAYYEDGDDYGNTGDLETETEEDGSGDSLDTTYFRYYTSSGSDGAADDLEYELDEQSYDRLAASLTGGVTPLTATNSEVADYAAVNYEYDEENRVVFANVQGSGCSCSGSTGTGTYTYIYTTSTNTASTDNWTTDTQETLPDTNGNEVYTNVDGEVMVSGFEDYAGEPYLITNLVNGTGHTDTSPIIGGGSSVDAWVTAYRYDTAGRLILTAQPSVVTLTTASNLESAASDYPDILGYNATFGSYANLSSDAGLIELTNYATSTTATSSTAGNVAGYLKNDEVENGYDGTPILTDSTQYFTRTAGGVTIAPIATSTVYRNTNGTGAKTTSYAYTWYSGTVQMESMAVSSPIVSSGQDGPGTADVNTIIYNSQGWAIWTQDGDGFLDYTAYDDGTGAVTKSIVDVNTSMTSEFTGLPSGWSTPTGGGLNLVTTYEVDGLGRTTEETSPDGNVTYTTYDDPDHEVRVYPGWNATTGTTTGPTQVTREDWDGGYTETLTMDATPAVSGSAGSYVPTGTEAISSLLTLSRVYDDTSNRETEEDDYFNLTGLTYSTATYIGTVGTNYYKTTYGYDEMGRLDLVDDADGTITITIYDALGRAGAIYVGTNDSDFWTTDTSSNMIPVTLYQYDDGGIGDSDLTSEIDYPDSDSDNSRVTLDAYDWRDRLVASKQGDQLAEGPEASSVYRPLIYYTLDNLGETTSISKFDGDNVTLSATEPSSSLLRAYVVVSYDDQGRQYEQQQYEVNQTTGAVSTYALTTTSYYDHRGDTIAVYAPGGLVTKDQYDGAGRLIDEAETDGAGGTTWAEASNLAGDHVLTQTLTTYDGDGNPILVTTKDVFNTDTTDTGALGGPTTAPYARVYDTAYYYDAADRLVATANVGTNGGSAYTRPSSVPTSSATDLVSTNQYNAAGWDYLDTDPKGIETYTTYDALGRPTEAIEAYNASIDDGLPTNSANQTTTYTYDGLGNILTQTAVMPSGTSNQTTTYVYGVTTSGGSEIDDNDLLDSLTQPNGSDTTTYTYDALGDTLTMTDANGTTHTYGYDVLGRQTRDAVTTLGSGVDGTVRLLTTSYDALGNVFLSTSYSAVSGGTVVNQVEDVYNGLGQLIGEYQAVSGSVDTSTTPEVQYAYTEMSGGQDNSRQTSMTYPNGRVIDYVYDSGIDSSISRLSAIVDDATDITLESYSYLGLDTLVAWDHPQTGVDLTYLEQSGDTHANTLGGDQYTGLDQFGRVIDQNWVNTSTGSSDVRYQYGYDQDSNVLYRNDLVDSALSELYHSNSSASGDDSTAYDALGRLTGFVRGTLSASGNNGTTLDTVSSPSSSQSWSYDALGNQIDVTTNGTSVTQGFNTEDQETSTTSGSAPTYDADGNTLTSAGLTYVYNAWNMIVSVTNTSTDAAAANYAYDALGRRIEESYAGGSTNYLYYNSNWQVIEQREGGTSSSNVQYQYVYGASGDMILRDTYSSGSIVPADRLFDLWDANGDITALTNTSGTVVERYEYSSYGAVTVLTASGSPVTGNVSAYGWQYLFQGGRQDSATGLYIYQNRDYDPNSGTWMERDPIGLAGDDENLYRFVGNDPEEYEDNSGFKRIPEVGIDDVGKIKGATPVYDSINQVTVRDINDDCEGALRLLLILWQSLQRRGYENSPAYPGYKPWRQPGHAEIEAQEKRAYFQLLANYTNSTCGGKGNGPSSPWSPQPQGPIIRAPRAGDNACPYDPLPNIPLWYRIEMNFPDNQLPRPITVPDPRRLRGGGGRVPRSRPSRPIRITPPQRQPVRR